jgi:hypothetical protein
MICENFMPHFMLQWFTKNFKDFSLNVFLKKLTHKMKQPKTLQKSLHLEYYISTHLNKFHPQIVNTLFVIEFQNIFEFQVKILNKNIGDSNWKSNRMVIMHLCKTSEFGERWGPGGCTLLCVWGITWVHKRGINLNTTVLCKHTRSIFRAENSIVYLHYTYTHEQI